MVTCFEMKDANRLGDWMFNADTEWRFASRRDAREFAFLVLVEAARNDPRGDAEAAAYAEYLHSYATFAGSIENATAPAASPAEKET